MHQEYKAKDTSVSVTNSGPLLFPYVIQSSSGLREFSTQSYSQEPSQFLCVHTKKRKSREGWEEGGEERKGETDFCIVFGFREAGCSVLSLHLQNSYGYPNHLASSPVNEVMPYLHKTHTSYPISKSSLDYVECLMKHKFYPK